MNTSSPIVQALGWSLVHFIWQGLVVAVIAAAVLRSMKQYAATYRYATVDHGSVANVNAGG
jgi:hypothetical protein